MQIKIAGVQISFLFFNFIGSPSYLLGSQSKQLRDPIKDTSYKRIPFAGNTSTSMHHLLGLREGWSILKELKVCRKTIWLLEEELGENERNAVSITRTNMNFLPETIMVS